MLIEMISEFSVIFAPILLIVLTCRGYNIGLAALAATCLAIFMSGLPVWHVVQENFFKAFLDFSLAWMPLFLSGAIFGAAMYESGFAASIGRFAARSARPGSVLLVIMLIALLLSYGGVGTFIIAFVMYPIADILFRKVGLSRGLLPAVILFCPTTLAMTMLPGSPSIQNLLPSQYAGTSIYAAPCLGLAVSLVVFICGFAYLAYTGKIIKVDLPFSDDRSTDMEEKLFSPAQWVFTLMPFVILWVASFIGIRLGLESKVAVPIGIVAATALCMTGMRNWNNIKGSLSSGIKAGFSALIMVSAIMGFGAVMKITPGYAHITDWISGLNNSPLVSTAVFINIIAAITGSSAASLEIFLSSHWTNLLASGIQPDILHRFVAIASSGLDSMPYASGIAMTLHLSGISLKEAYPHIFITCAVIPLLATAGVIIWLMI